MELANYYKALPPMEKFREWLETETDIKKVAKFDKAVEAAKRVDRDNDERARYWGELGIWSFRRLGELLIEGKTTGIFLEQGRPKKRLDHQTFFTLADLDLSKFQSSRSQQFAKILEKALREHISKYNAALTIVTKSSLAPLLNSQRIATPPPAVVQTPGFPDGPFRSIVIDPPWPIEKIMFQRRAVEKKTMDYQTASLEEIEALPIKKLADDRGAHIYLWVTHRFLPAGLKLFEAWGVRYECLLTWNKPTAQPLWWRFLTEHCLFGKIGALSPLVKGQAVSFSAPQQKHSHKPEAFFDLVRKVSPEPRLTMFDYDRKGFQSWGVTH